MNYDKDKFRGDEDELLDDDLDLAPTFKDGDHDELTLSDGETEADDAPAASDSDEDAYAEEPEEETPRSEAPRSAASGRRRGRIFKIDGEDDGNDFYDGEPEDEEEQARPAQKVRPPRLDPEDPDYWIDDDESPIRRIIPTARSRWKWWIAAIGAILILICFAWIWFMRPHTDGAVKYGYLKHMERRGSIVKTFEGVLIPYRELGDSTPTYFEEMRFSVESDSVAARMKKMMLDCVPVRLEYELYHAALPWKGAERMVVVGVDTADVDKILPPEYRWKNGGDK